MLAKGTSPIIWPLRLKLSVPLAAQQNARSQANLLRSKFPINLPWNAVSARANVSDEPFLPRVIHELLPQQATRMVISGVSRDSTGAVLPGCTCTLFSVSAANVFTQVDQTVSDATSGVYTMIGAVGKNYAVRFDLAGAPARAGTTLTTLTVAVG